MAQTPEERLAKSRAYNKKSKDAVRDFIVASKDVPCADCGGEYPHYCMDFDHRPDEPFGFHISGQYGRGIALVAAEIAKCDVICANCHRIRTHTRTGAYGPRST